MDSDVESAYSISDAKMDVQRENDIISRLDYIYPHLNSRSLKSKYSVSEINRWRREDLEESFRREIRITTNKQEENLTGFSAAEKGTIYHKIMEGISFVSFSDIEERAMLLQKLEDEIDNLVERKIISNEEVAAIDIDNIAGFFESDLGRRAIAADIKGLLRKEQPFTLKMEKDLVEDDILVQGIIDCFFLEEVSQPEDFGTGPMLDTGMKLSGYKTVLVDYKSSKIDKRKSAEEEERRLREEYQGQIDIYRMALEEANLGPVSEAYLYLLNTGDILPM